MLKIYTVNRAQTSIINNEEQSIHVTFNILLSNCLNYFYSRTSSRKCWSSVKETFTGIKC